MQKSMNNQRHVRDTLAILLSKKNHKSVQLLHLINEGSKSVACSKVLAYILYERLLTRSLASTSSYTNMDLWMPSGVFGKLGTISVFEQWLISNDRANEMDSSDLLLIGSITGWHAAWRFLVKAELVRVTRSNRIRIEYPIDGKMYSLDYAGIKMRSLLKKKPIDNEVGKPSLDMPAQSSVVLSPPEEVVPDDNFWETN